VSNQPIVTVFRSRLRPEAGDRGYHELATEMETRARAMPGFMDFKSFSSPDGERVSLIVFDTREHQEAWRKDPEHRAAQKRGRDEYYSEYSIQVCELLHRRDFTAPAGKLAAAETRHHHHSELTDPQLTRLLDVLPAGPFSANEALAAALSAGVVNSSADISSALDDLEDAGRIRQVGRNRWTAVTADVDPDGDRP
jgi:heme-degrading monooxygenase HmoA